MKIFKIITDVLLLAVTFLLVNDEFTGRFAHELLGIFMGVLLIIHICLNWKWIKNVSRNFKKVNKKTKAMYIINMITMLSYFGAIILGIIISQELFNFKTGSNFKLILAHIIFGNFSVIAMFLHLGINFEVIFARLKNKKLKTALKVIYTVAATCISIYLIFKLTHSFEWQTVFKTAQAQIIKSEKPGLFFSR